MKRIAVYGKGGTGKSTLAAKIDASTPAFSGGFVPPGPCGSPTRGRTEILPTGRNFFSPDPRTLPSAAAGEVGKTPAHWLLKRCPDERGKYLESIGISVWGVPAKRRAAEPVLPRRVRRQPFQDVSRDLEDLRPGSAAP